MKKLDWRILVLAGLAVLAVLASFFSPALVVSTAVCFWGILGFMAWERWLVFQEKKTWHEQVEPLEKSIREKDRELAELRAQLIKTEKVRNAPPVDLPEKRLLDLAGSLRTKTTLQTKPGEASVQTIDEVPPEIRAWILERLNSTHTKPNDKK